MNGLAQLGREIAREQDRLRAQEPALHEVRQALVDLPHDVATKPRRGLPLGLGLGATVLAAAAAWLLWVRPAQPAAPLTLAVGAKAQPAGAGAWLEAPKGEPLPLRFSDGTRIDMAPRSRARVVTLDAVGAHILLESGVAHMKVTRKPHAAWRVSAGPFAVKVTGTRFDVRWNPEQDEFELNLTEGHVEVSGCVLGQGYRMSAGQTVHASCRRGHFDVGAASPIASPQVPAAQQAVGLAPAAAASGVGVADAAEVNEAAPVRSRVHGVERGLAWRALAQQGQFREAFAAANQAGFDSLCGSAGADDSSLLADSARYAGDMTKQAQALRSIRRRFAATQRAALAAFALGRLEFDEHGAYGKAARWFRTYLKEQPRGALAREARGRLLEATWRAGDGEAARELAQSYLHDYPVGPHAKLAQRIVVSAEP